MNILTTNPFKKYDFSQRLDIMYRRLQSKIKRYNIEMNYNYNSNYSIFSNYNNNNNLTYKPSQTTQYYKPSPPPPPPPSSLVQKKYIPIQNKPSLVQKNIFQTNH
jgi:hypothetical protein